VEVGAAAAPEPAVTPGDAATVTEDLVELPVTMSSSAQKALDKAKADAAARAGCGRLTRQPPHHARLSHARPDEYAVVLLLLVAARRRERRQRSKSGRSASTAAARMRTQDRRASQTGAASSTRASRSSMRATSTGRAAPAPRPQSFLTSWASRAASGCVL
jgi:hypothetical protein